MLNVKNMMLFILIAVVIGLLMAYQADMPFGWQRAAVAALAFGALGWLLSILVVRRK